MRNSVSGAKKLVPDADIGGVTIRGILLQRSSYRARRNLPIPRWPTRACNRYWRVISVFDEFRTIFSICTICPLESFGRGNSEDEGLPENNGEKHEQKSTSASKEDDTCNEVAQCKCHDPSDDGKRKQCETHKSAKNVLCVRTKMMSWEGRIPNGKPQTVCSSFWRQTRERRGHWCSPALLHGDSQQEPAAGWQQSQRRLALPWERAGEQRENSSGSGAGVAAHQLIQL